MSILKITSDKDCSLYYNNELIIEIRSNVPAKINVRKGSYNFEFRPKDQPQDIIILPYCMKDEDIEDSIKICMPVYKEENPILSSLIKYAELGDTNAQVSLGLAYNENGDRTTAKYWFEKAAENDNVYGIHNAGCSYCDMNMLEIGFQYFKRAADMGLPAALYSVGECMINGYGTEKNYSEGVGFIAKAADLGYEPAIEKIQDYFCPFELDYSKFATKECYYLFFDTETTGIPANYNAPMSDINNWPRLVQLAWILCDEDGNIIEKETVIIKPRNFVIPQSASSIHGISTERALNEGVDLKDALLNFSEKIKMSKVLVGHNISFDINIVGSELIRANLDCTVKNMKSICTMKSSVNFCAISGYNGYKWPKLEELYRKLFGKMFEDAHDALADISATHDCFFEMKKRGII